MIQTFADLCTYVYVIVDELYQVVAAPHDHRPGERSAFSDSEVIALTLVAELVEMDKESRFLAYVRRNRRALLELVLGRLAPEERELCVLDSLPVPVVGFHHARGRHRWYGEASYGYVAAKQLTSFGYKLHLLITAS